MSWISVKDVDLTSTIIFDGLSINNKVDFIDALSINIYKRILGESLSVIALESDIKNKVLSCSANNPIADPSAGLNHGFIEILSTALAKRKNQDIYYFNRLKNNTMIFMTSKPTDYPSQLKYIKFFQSKNNESLLISEACEMIFDVYNAAATGINASKSILLKIEDMSQLIKDKAVSNSVEAQIKSTSDAIKNGKVAYMSSGSSLEFVHFDTTPSQTALAFCFNLISMATGYPMDFWNGVGGSSLSDTGESSAKAIRRANINHAVSLLIPFLNEVFNKEFTISQEIGSISDIREVVALIETNSILSPSDIKKLLSLIGMEGNQSAFIVKSNNEVIESSPIDDAEYIEVK